MLFPNERKCVQLAEDGLSTQLILNPSANKSVSDFSQAVWHNGKEDVCAHENAWNLRFFNL